jgi:hypothetical protein
MAARGWVRDDLIRISGQSQSVVSQWLGKSSKIIKTIGKMEAAQALARESGYESLWIAKGIGPKKSGQANAPREPMALAHFMSHARPIVELPRFSWEQLMTADLSQPFELVVDDDALAPDIFKGCIARFDPAREPAPGRPVLVRDASGRFHLRDYQAGPSGRWQAVARARGFTPLDSQSDGLELVAVMRGYDWP